MDSCNLNVNHLRAALICAASKDIRYYLNAVLVSVRAREVLTVSTDGHRLSVIRRAHAEDEADCAPAEIIIPRDTLKGIKAARGLECVLHYDAANPLAECKLDGLKDGGRTFAPVDARYPDWTRVIPAKVSGKSSHFNPFYLADFTSLVQMLANGNSFAEVHPNGDGCAGVTCAEAPEFHGALMPMRFSLPEYALPEWLAGRPEKLKAVA